MKFIHHSQEVNVADGVDIDVKVNIQFLPEVLFRFFSLKQLKIFKNNSTLKPVSVIPVSVSSLTSFFSLRQIGALHHGRPRQDIYPNVFSGQRGRLKLWLGRGFDHFW